jgi:hypothetical protein
MWRAAVANSSSDMFWILVASGLSMAKRVQKTMIVVLKVLWGKASDSEVFVLSCHYSYLID